MILGIACALVLLLWSALVFSLKRHEFEQIVANDVALSPQWVEIAPSQPLLFQKQRQWIILVLREPLIKDNSHLDRIRLSDGTLIRPEIQLVDRLGNVTSVEIWRAMNPTRYDNSVVGDVRNNGQGYVKVRVRCDIAVHVTQIIWGGADYK